MPYYKKKSFKKDTYTKSQSIGTSTHLMIVESPSKCKKIEGFLGSQYKCIASNGHIRTIDGLKSIDIKHNTFEPIYTIIDEKKSHVEYMKTIIQQYPKSNIILATDDDREGESIAWHICDIFELDPKTTKRILFHEITQHAIQESIQTPTVINLNLVNAQKSRQVLDMIVGYKISPMLWKYLYNNKENSLSAGRCQTPALRLIYDNHQEFLKNESTEKYKTMGCFFSKNLLFELSKEFDKKEEVLLFLENSKTWDHTISTTSPKSTIKNPPKPFNTSNLLQTTNNSLNMSPKETMQLCQTLYQEGWITYMRTDSTKYCKSFLEEMKIYIVSLYKKEEYIGSLQNIENNDSANPHEAIRVTDIKLQAISHENTRLCSLYKLIWRNTMESCMSTAKYNTVDINITAPMSLKYKYTIETPVFLGWKKVSNKETETGSQNEDSGMLFYIKSIANTEKPISYNWIESNVVIRGKHQYYTEANLINKLEELGIGRPSTFASIVEIIKERGYVKCQDIEGIQKSVTEYKLSEGKIIDKKTDKTFGSQKNKLVIQSLGIITLDFLIQNFNTLFSYDYTRIMEKELDIIATKNTDESANIVSWNSVCKTCLNEITELLKPLSKVGKQSFALHGHTDKFVVYDKYGPVIKQFLEDGSVKYISIKKSVNLDLNKLKSGEYTLEDLMEINEIHLGKYQEEDLYLKNGKYGMYAEWGDNKESIKTIDKPSDEITYEDVVEFLTKKTEPQCVTPTTSGNIIRILTDNLSIRKGKFGAYIYHKLPTMAKPKFYTLNKFTKLYSMCEEQILIDWINNTYNLNEKKS